MARSLTLAFEQGGAVAERDVVVDAAVIAGWTGRDEAAREAHIAELEALGIKRPASTPIFYQVAAARITGDGAIEVVGGASSGEVEYLLLRHDGRSWIGVGSDHTDREVEAYGVTVSKQLCDKPIGPRFWLLDDVAPHWDRLVLRSWAIRNGERSLYQEGGVGTMLGPTELASRFAGVAGLPDGTLMFCGTLAVRGGVRSADRFEFEIEDPVLRRRVQHGYAVRMLPIAG